MARPDVVPLTIARGRIVNLEEELEYLSIADPGRIENDLDCFRMSAVIAIGGIGCTAARGADAARENAVVAAKQILHTPETTAGEYSTFLSHCQSSATNTALDVYGCP